MPANLTAADERPSDQNASSTSRCYECFRPVAFCFCDAIPSIDNRTEVVILQHRRERFHRFNTARIVQKALRNSQLLADHIANLAQRLQLKPRAGLLYPGPSTLPIDELTADERPEQLVVLDGTWHHAKTLLRDIPALQCLPRYQLAPAEPSRYRIRREPNDMSLSTVEAAVAALRVLEPQTRGFEQLLRAFDTMVDVQLAHPGSAAGARFRARRNRSFKNIPLALHGDLANIVVAYGESEPGERGQKRANGPPISWVAQRLGDGATFSCRLNVAQPLSDEFLRHLELTRGDFLEAVSLDDARAQWARFHRPGDIVTVLRPGTARLWQYLSGDRAACLVLKAVDVELDICEGQFKAIAQKSDLSHPNMNKLGRAGKRLAEAIAVVRRLNALFE